jgi:hypothetical protein
MKGCWASGLALSALGLAMASGAQAQESSWAYFEPEGAPMQAGLQSANGGQLILKCDETGEDKVFAVIFSPSRLRPPSNQPQVRALWLRYDDGPREEVRWRYYDQTVLALNTRRDSNLGPFLNDLVDATNLEIRLDATDGAPVELNFAVAGAREAIARVFESCRDTNVVE